MHRLGEQPGHQRRVLGGLQDDGAAGREGRDDLGDDLVQRVVPRRDRGDHAGRLGVHGGVADLLLELVPGQDGEVGAGDGERERGLDGRGEADRASQLGGHGRGDLRLAGGEAVAQAGQRRQALLAAAGRPGAGGRTGGVDGRVDVGGAAGRDGGDGLLGGGVEHGQGVGRERAAPGPADVLVCVLLHGWSSPRGVLGRATLRPVLTSDASQCAGCVRRKGPAVWRASSTDRQPGGSCGHPGRWGTMIRVYKPCV